MSDDYSSRTLEVRRRKLDELFADQPFLSATMKASRVHERLADTPARFQIPVLPVTADDEMLRRLESARRDIQLDSLAVSEMPIQIERPRKTDHVEAPCPRTGDSRSARLVTIEPPRPAVGLDERSNVLRLDLVLDTSVSPPQVRPSTLQQDRNLDVMTLAEAASFLRVGASTLRGLMRTDRLPAVRIGRQVRFRREAILAWLAEREA